MVQQQDWIEFLASLDRSYSDDFRKFLRDELHVKALICDSQVQWGGTTGYYRELGSDFIDTHAYWEHPEFLGGSWNPGHWKVARRSQVGELAKGEATALIDLARVRQLGKPFTVSEYDHPSVNDFQVEMIPMVASYGCIQDWTRCISSVTVPSPITLIARRAILIRPATLRSLRFIHR